MLILGSSSPRRKQLLSYLTPEFKILTADLDEASFIPLARSPQELVTKLSLAKAKKIITTHNLKNNIILAADTIISFSQSQNNLQVNDWQIIGKPKDLTEAKKTLKMLRAKTHQVFTGFSLVNQKTQKAFTNFVASDVTFKDFSDQKLNEYIDKFKPLDKAGSYAAQEMGLDYITKISGSYSSIIGLPLEETVKALKNLNISISPNWQNNFKKDFTLINQLNSPGTTI